MFSESFNSETEKINSIIKNSGAIDEGSFFEKEIRNFLVSRERGNMIMGERYYCGEQDIIKRKRRVIGEGGKLTEVYNLPNNRIVDNQYAKLVDQKVNYLLSKPLTFCADNKRLLSEVKNILGKSFLRVLKAVGEDSLKGGIGWLYIYINENGMLDFSRFKPFDIIPFWADSDHTRLDCVIRLYSRQEYRGKEKRYVKFAEVYKKEGILTYVIENGRLIPTGKEKSYFYDNKNTGYHWGKIPIIGFKQNSREIPLIKRVKSLQDALNEIRSDYLNNMQEDKRNTILVIKNYDGADLGQFRRNLSEYGAVKVRTVDGAEGGIDTLSIDVDSDNYTAVCDMLKKAITENGRGFDPRDERFNSNPNQMNILSMYSDIDLDANGMENEFQASFEEVFYFVKKYLAFFGKGNYGDELIQVIFNRDQMINESEIIDSCVKSSALLSEESVIAQHPWVSDVYEEIRKKALENKGEGL